LHRAVVAQALLDRAGDKARLGYEPLPRFGLPQKGQHRVADQVGRRFVAGVDEADDVAE
jgi:hypothetical protein